MELNKIYNIDCIEGLKQLEKGVIDCCVTSPPYWGLRDYNVDSLLGGEEDPADYIKNLCDVFDLVKYTLKDDGVLWVNLSDSYFRNGGKNKGENKKAKVGNTKKGIQKGNCKVPKGYLEKSLALIPQRFVLEMNSRGWIVRNQIIWHKPNAMPQSVRDRFVNDYEVLFMFTKQKRYKFNIQKENVTGKERLKRAVWSINTKPQNFGHIAPYPQELIETCILSSTDEGDIVLDPFIGSGTTGVVATLFNRNFIGFELNGKYSSIAKERIENTYNELIESK